MQTETLRPLTSVTWCHLVSVLQEVDSILKVGEEVANMFGFPEIRMVQMVRAKRTALLSS